MKLSNAQFMIFNLFLIIGGSSLSISNMMIQNHPHIAFLIPLLILPIILLFSFLKPINLKLIFNNIILKSLLLLYLMISSYILIINYLKITNNYFYNLTPPLVILIIILLLTIYISTYGIKNIIFVGTFVGFVTFILYFFTLFDFNNYDFNLISKIDFKLNNPFNLFNYLFIYLDILILPLFVKVKSKSKNFILIYILSCLINCLLILINYLYFDSNFFISSSFPYISKFLTSTNNILFEHLDITYLIIITFFIVFKLSINIEISRILLKIKKTSLKQLLIPIILLLITYLSSFLRISINILNIIMFISSCLIMSLILLNKLLEKVSYAKRIN